MTRRGMTRRWAEYAWTGGDRAVAGVLIETDGDRITRVETGVADPPADAIRHAGLTIPGLVNAHSHAFHRALRGGTQADRGSFWTWRERMYAVASKLQPENYFTLARATFAEMLLAGITTVGEFHYVHHRVDGTPYPEPTAMAEAVALAAAEAGIRLTLLDTCYLSGGFGSDPDQPHLPLSEEQRRFGDGSAAAWAARATRTRDVLTNDSVRVGAAVHSVRAVPADQLATVAEWAHGHQAPIHAHVSEQPAENADCLRVYGTTPTALLARHGVLDELASAVHATHLTDADLGLLATHGAYACFCPTTEADLADGIGPAAALVDRNVPLTLGSDSQAVIDLLREARELELGQRLVSNRRGHFRAADLLTNATVNGAASLGWHDLGQLTVGSLADFVTIGLDSVRTAGTAVDTMLETAVFAASATDVTTVVVGGRTVVDNGRHHRIPNVASELSDSIAALTAQADVQ